MKPYHCGGDISSVYRQCERSLKTLGITIKDFEPNLSDGDGVTYTKILRILLLKSCRDIAIQMISKGVSCEAGDRRIVLTAFDILRENCYSPNISADQFLSKNFIEHKIVIVQKVAEYINNIKRKVNSKAISSNISPQDFHRHRTTSSPDDSYRQYGSNKSFISNYENTINNDYDLDNEIWVDKYVNNLDDNEPLAISEEISNNNYRSSSTKTIINLIVDNNTANNNSTINNNINESVNDSNIKNLIVSEAELKKLIEIEVNKQIVFYREQQALIIENSRNKISILEKRIQDLEDSK